MNLSGSNTTRSGTRLACVSGWMNALGLLVIASLTTGCIVAPPVEEAPLTNRPLVVDVESISPSPAESQVLTQGQTIDFSIASAVHDPDGDSLFTYWYLYATGSTKGELVWVTPSYSLDPCTEDMDADSGWLLEVVVSDRQRKDLPEDLHDFPDEANWMTVAWWWIDVQVGGECP
jgi:hypothetical protein